MQTHETECKIEPLYFTDEILTIDKGKDIILQ